MINDTEDVRILIVEDNPDNIRLLGETLIEFGYQVCIAQDGLQALEVLQYMTPDLILLDVMMPRLNGFETCKRLKSSPETKDIPVIFLSAQFDTVDVVKGFKLGAVDYINKPFNQDELLARIETHVHLRMARKKLLESEKMTSLKVLVTGIAHEINTPLGMAITVNSFGSDKLNKVYNDNTEGEERLAAFEKLYKESISNYELVQTNLDRISKLVESFKQLSVDFTIPTQSEFNLKQYTNYIICSMESTLQEGQHELKVECEDIHITSSPDDFAVIITNLITNSINHGYEKGEKGVMKLIISSFGHELHIYFEDNGKGIPKENLSRIFDPFFTTKRGSHMGLGLNILYNLITQKLNGSIQCKSEGTGGTTFEIVLPVKECDHY